MENKICKNNSKIFEKFQKFVIDTKEKRKEKKC